MTDKTKLLALAEADNGLPRTLEEIHKRALDRYGRRVREALRARAAL